ncbi:MAG: 2-dehydro-3-deoxygalactonokinase [Pseudolabrys sp.]|nr:2-dehydro-3-deoxygalactonokinase [Pseudolabrys sp.]
MIVVDWGTSSFRTFRIAADGAILDRRSSANGIMHVPGGRFAETLREQIGDWLDAGESRVLLAGMIGSRQGWKEAPYVACPAGAAELGAALVDVPFDGAQVKLVPGMNGVDASGVAEVMRGEETQIVGALAAMGGDGLACLPGTHSKWVRVENGRIVRFTSHMTGEVFSALREHTILGRMMKDGAPNEAAFIAGVARSAEPGGALHHLFGVRTQTLFGKFTETDGPSYLSGLLIGHELRAELGSVPGETVHLIGAPELVALYKSAIAACGAKAVSLDAEASVRGLAIIGEHAQWR